MKMKIVNGLVWLVVTDKAKEVLSSRLFELYILHEDGSESLVTEHATLNRALSNGRDIAIEVGHLSNINL